MLVNDIADPIAVPLLVDEALVLAPKLVQLVFIVALGTVKLILVPPLYNVPLALPFAVVQLFLLNVTVKLLLQL